MAIYSVVVLMDRKAKARAYWSKYRADGRRIRKPLGTPSGRLTFCLKCVSEKEINGKCPACDKVRRQRVMASPEFKARRKVYRSDPKVRAKENASAREWYYNNRERDLAKWNEWARSNPAAISAKVSRRRALLLGAEGAFTAAEFKSICDSQFGRCASCRVETRLTADHIVPLSRGGSNHASNIQGLCKSCNSRKRDTVIT